MLPALRRPIRASGTFPLPHDGSAHAPQRRRPDAVLLWALLGVASAAVAGEAEFGPAGAAFVLRAQGRCLEVNEPQLRVDGARVHLQRCDGEPHQTWRRERGRIVNVANGRCLDLHGPDAGFNGGRVQTVACSNAPNQQWELEQGRLLVRVDGRCLLAGRAHGAGEGDRRGAWSSAMTWDCGAQGASWQALPPPAPIAPPPPVVAPPRVRDLEAGPLFNQGEAERKCPAVCAPARWSGRWVTTVPGRMSVCGCVDEAPPAPAVLPGGPMAEGRFGELVRLLESEAFPANALHTLEMVARDHRFDTDQVRRLFGPFPFGRDRLRVLEIALPRLVDRPDAYRLIDAFDFDSEKAEARRLVDRASGAGR